MTRTATIRARVSPDLKYEAEAVFTALGVSPAEAIRLFYRQVTLHRGLPFDVKLPNEETRETMQLALVGEDLVEYTGLDELKATFGPAHAPDHDETI